jgi:hypothetical protein
MASLAAWFAPLLLSTSLHPRRWWIRASRRRSPRSPLQRVIVEVAEDEPDRPPAFLPQRADRLRRQAAREAALERRKARILARAQQARPGAVLEPLARFPSFALAAVQADAAGIEALAADPEVAAVHFDRISRPQGEASFAFTGATLHHAQGMTGAGTSGGGPRLHRALRPTASSAPVPPRGRRGARSRWCRTSRQLGRVGRRRGGPRDQRRGDRPGDGPRHPNPFAQRAALQSLLRLRQLAVRRAPALQWLVANGSATGRRRQHVAGGPTRSSRDPATGPALLRLPAPVGDVGACSSRCPPATRATPTG